MTYSGYLHAEADRDDEARDAARYRALKATEQAAPWRDVLGAHGTLDSLADALVAAEEFKSATEER